MANKAQNTPFLSPTASATQREREFYRYYEPLHAAAEAQDVPKGHRPRSSLDKTLAAFAQLGALRLNARRAMISFFDRKTQFVLAEATKTVSLQTDLAEDPEDALWLGVSQMHMGNGICENTIQLPMMYKDEEEGDFTDVTVNIIPDLATDARFSNKAYVCEGPKARFYVGVPIRSPTGRNLGSYCILDDKPRDGLTPQEISFMKDMATTTMMHLEAVRARQDNKRGERMVRGLGSFVEGRNSLFEWRPKSWEQEQMEKARQSWYIKQFAMQRLEGRSPKISSSADTSDARIDRVSMLKRAGTDEGVSTPSRTASSSSLKTIEDDPRIKAKTSNRQDQAHSLDVKKTFARAANIICEATEVEGCVLYDASVGTFGGLVEGLSDDERNRSGSDPSNSSEAADLVGALPDAQSSQSDSSDRLGKSQKRKELDAKQCGILGFSVHGESSLDADQPGESYAAMTEGFLRSLLKRYRNGKIFNFDERVDSPPGQVQNEEAASQEDTGAITSTQALTTGSRRRRPNFLQQRSSSKRRLKSSEVKMIQKLFAGVRSLAVVPLWDTHRRRFYAGGFVWSTSALRMLSADQELNYLLALGDTIMAEVARIEARIADKAKTDFVASISHELRSPLHGILGSIECLQDTLIDPFQENLIHTVETCGKTLLDTIDNLLDFAKINNFSRSANDYKRSTTRGGGTKGAVTHSTSKKQQIALDVDVDLSVITEEVMETVFAGYEYLKVTQTGRDESSASKQTSYDVFASDVHKASDEGAQVQAAQRKGLIIIVEIDKAEQSHWIFRTQAGAWRRVLMNLFGNSLKYTDAGFIHVRLAAKPLPAKHQVGRSEVTLTVADSGRGISEDYLKTKLFVAFQQEDRFTSGTGLGMSIVKQIVTAMDGTIDVQSQQGHGTIVSVKVLMTHAPLAQETVEQSLIKTTYERCKGMKVGFVGFGPDEIRPDYADGDLKNAMFLFMDSFRKLCVNWFGLDMHFVKTVGEDEGADIYLTTEEGGEEVKKGYLARLANDAFKAPTTPLLILCQTASTAQGKIKKQERDDVASYISQPCGPRKLAKALMLCLERGAAAKEDRKNRPPALTGATSSAGDDVSVTDAIAESKEKDDGTRAPPLTHTEPRTSGPDSPAGHMSQWSTEIPPRSPPIQVASPKNSVHDVKPPLGNDGHASDSTSVGAERQGQSTKTPTSAATPKEGHSVLLVDDNSINLQLLVTYMKKKKHVYVCASNGLEAAEAFEEATPLPKASKTVKDTLTVGGAAASSPADHVTSRAESATRPGGFDYIVMDVSMPVMDGLESTRRIRAHEKAVQAAGVDIKPATVIALTGLASTSARQEAFSSGVDLFLTKPVKLKELSKIMEGDSTK